ncbi:MAG: amidohydrolase family protein [Rhodospirillaceae bacterium]|nr:amidohydrolase family protein [Rhodospirillaceae bacterium]MBT5523538.1 amidohydrolase family protein [Rhodospirillaceae bacterium]MBT5880487.1 amidohydrolase family protein [Rhodospirillaceae bacterium]MBT6591770.1 amidohydrolase family protein [Rhodospirillaceae bacterium]MBT7284650.1 amidohydrolase family protein [Rhodospirillaceae bacterium]
MHDLVIRGGVIVDGSGAEKATGDVAIDGDRLSQVGGTAGAAREEIDADGAVVAPGWVDIHTHYDGQVTWDPHLTPSGWHGVTTAIMGNCGVGFAPVAPDAHDQLIRLMEGVEDIPGSALAAGIKWDWESFPEYLDALDAMPRSLDVGTQVPHGAIRTYVMGDRGATNQPANPDDMAGMADIVEQGLKAGALGFSTSRTMLHRSLDGEPVPGTFAGADELMAIGQGMKRAGHGVFELATDFGLGGMGGKFGEDMDWMVRLAKDTGLLVTFILGQADTVPDEWREILKLTRAARGTGADVRALVAGRPAGLLLGLQSSLHPFMEHPTYKRFAHLPLAERVAALSTPENRAALLSEKSGFTGRFNPTVATSYDKMFPLGDPLDYEPTQDKSIAAIASREGRSGKEVCLDYLLSRDGKEMLYYPLISYSNGDFEVLREMLENEDTLLSLSDGGAHCGLICDAAMPSYLMTHWVRDRTRGPRLGLEQAVKYQTRDTALSYGLKDRGLLAEGLKADLNVMNLDDMRLKPPYMIDDLPANGRRLVQEVDGYLATVSGGEVTYRDGVATGAMPGKLIRGPQAN